MITQQGGVMDCKCAGAKCDCAPLPTYTQDWGLVPRKKRFINASLPPIKNVLPVRDTQSATMICKSHPAPYGFMYDLVNGQCILTDTRKRISTNVPKRRRFNWLPVIDPQASQCLKHQAPRGYKYTYIDGACRLTDLRGREVVPRQIEKQIVTTNIDGAASAISSPFQTAKAWLQNNSTVVLIALGAGAYFYAKSK